MNKKLYFILATVSISFGNFFVNYFLSQNLEIETYGEFSLIYSTIALIVPFILLGQSAALTSAYFSDEKLDCKNISHEILLAYKIMLGGAVLTSSLLLIIWKIYYANFETWFIILFLLTLSASTLNSFFSNLIVIFDKYKYYLIASIFSTFILIINIIFNPSIIGYFMGVIFSGLVFIFVGIYQHKIHSEISSSNYLFKWKHLFVLGSASIPGMLISTINTYMDRFVINYYLDLQQVAYYSLAATLGVGVGKVFITALLKGEIVSILGSLQTNDINSYMAVQKNIQLTLVVISFVTFVLYYLYGDVILLSIFGDKYSNSIGYILPLFLIVVINGIANLYTLPLIQKKKLYVLVMIGCIVVILNLVLNIVFINIFYVKGVILAVYIASLAEFILAYRASIEYFDYLKFPIYSLISISALIILSLFYGV